MSSTTNLIKQVLGEGARNTKYDILFQFSNTSLYTNYRDAAVLAKTASFPGKGHTPVNLLYKGRIIPIRGQVKYNNTWECTFYVPEDHALKLAFETWVEALDETVFFSQEQTANEAATRKVHNSGDYTVDITLYQLNINEDRKTVQYVLHNAFPTDVQAISLSAEGPAQISEVTVTFAYSHYTSMNTVTSQGTFSSNWGNNALDALAGQITNMVQTSNPSKSEFVSTATDAMLNLASNNANDKILQQMVKGNNPDYQLNNFVSVGVEDLISLGKDLLGNITNTIKNNIGL